MPAHDALKRFLAAIHTNHALFDCWTWQSGTNDRGYGKFSVDGRLTYTHRWAYEQLHGPIPDGLVIDHLCRVRNCANPLHLEAVPHLENVARGLAGVGPHPTCKNGHPQTADSAWHTKGKGWKCKACHRELVNRRYHEKRAEKISGVISPY